MFYIGLNKTFFRIWVRLKLHLQSAMTIFVRLHSAVLPPATAAMSASVDVNLSKNVRDEPKVGHSPVQNGRELLCMSPRREQPVFIGSEGDDIVVSPRSKGILDQATYLRPAPLSRP